MNNVSNSWSTAIDKLMTWRGSWVKYDAKTINAILRIHYDQLFITTDTKILETFNMNIKMKGIYKGDILILIVNNSAKEIRKIKFQVKKDAAQCFHILGLHFPVVCHNSSQPFQVLNPKYRNIDEALKLALENKAIDNGSSLNLPSDFSNFIKLCLLDPSFPQMVVEVEKILKKEFVET